MKRTSDIILTTLSLSFLFLFGFQYLSAWTEPTLAPPAGNITSSGAFQETTSVTQQGDTPGYDEDFVFGSPSLDYDSDANHASRMFFDEGTGAFRAGYNNTTSWNNANVGSRSASFGYNTRAAGTYSFSAGYYAEAWSSHSIALGYNTDAYYGASAIGFGADSYGNYSTALGNYAYTNSAAPYSTAIGYYAKSYDDYAVTIGKYVRNDTMNSIMLGIGTANPAAHTTNPGIFVDGSNNVGIGTDSPGTYKLKVAGITNFTDDVVVNGDLTFAPVGDHTISIGATNVPFDLTIQPGYNNNFSESGNLIFATGQGTERIRVNKSGNVGIGTASVDAGLALDVEGSVGASQYCDENGANCFTAPEVSGGGNTFTNGTVTKDLSEASGIQNIAHGLGEIPKKIKLTCLRGLGSEGVNIVVLAYNGTTASEIGRDYINGANRITNGSTLKFYGGINQTEFQTGTVTFDANNIIINWVKTSNPTGIIQVLWEAES